MELPTTSVALFFRLFGLSEAAGRLPMGLWGAVGLAALHMLLRRLSTLRTATYGTLVLATMPLYFVHARTMLGDVVAMAGALLAFAGLGIAALDPEPRAPRKAAAAIGVVGLVVGHFSRGALLGVAVPCLSVAVVAALSPREERHPQAVRGKLFVLILAVAGVVVAAATGLALRRAAPGPLDPFLGSTVLAGARYPTFDATVAVLGYALFPWSALLPFVIGRLFAVAPRGAEGDLPALRALADQRLRALVAVGGALGLTAHAVLADAVGTVPFVHVGLLAAAVGIALGDLEITGVPSRAVACATAVLSAVLVLDFTRFPEKGIALYGVPGAMFPPGFEEQAARYVVLSATVFSCGILAACLDADGPPSEREGDGCSLLRRISVHREARTLFRDLAEAHEGNVAFVAIMLQAALVGVAAVVVLSETTSLLPAPALTARGRLFALSSWLVVPGLLVSGYFLLGAGRRALSLLLHRAAVPRARLVAFSGVLAGAVFFFGYFPALSRHISPKELFETYARIAGPGEPLGLLGVATRSKRYYTDAETLAFGDASEAFTWLVGGGAGERRFLALRAGDLGRMNALFREHADAVPGAPPDRNLPVLHGGRGLAQLVSNVLRPTEENQNELVGIVGASPPRTRHPLAANVGDQVEAVGWDLVDVARGASVVELETGRRYLFRFHLRVLAPVETEWDTFLHLEGQGKRFAVDHKALAGRYPMSLWRVGDYVTDTLEVTLDPSFRPGVYSVYAGLFVGEKRLPVLSGPHHDNRVEAGVVRVR